MAVPTKSSLVFPFFDRFSAVIADIFNLGRNMLTLKAYL